MKKLPKSLTRVTGFSKLLALFIIIAFVFSAFYAGLLFDKVYAPAVSSITPTPTRTLSSQNSCSVDSDCILTSETISYSCCPNTKCQNLADASIVAVSSSWLAQEKIATCGSQRMCPMIAVLCSKGVQQENTHYRAKCIQHVCTKVRT